MYYIYMLRCKDGSIYTGITTQLSRRMEEHFLRKKNCAKYTARHTAIKLENAWKTDTRSHALKLEYHLKTLKKEQKERLIQDNTLLETFLKDKIDILVYEQVPKEELRNIYKKRKYNIKGGKFPFVKEVKK